MSEINFGELNGYNTVMEYSMKLLEIIKSLDSKEPDFESMKKLADPQYEYASAKLICMIQSINFFQLYEKYGKDASISSYNMEKIVELLEDLKIDGMPKIDINKKEKIFRNCLAHGRYTLSMDENGEINVIFDDPSLVIDGNKTRVTGQMPYSVFSDLSTLYIDSVNIEKIEIRENPEFESTSIKNSSMDKIYRTFFKSIHKFDVKYDKTFSAYNDLATAVREYQEDTKDDRKYRNLQQKSVQFVRDTKNDVTRTQVDLTEEEQEFFKKYFDFIGKKKFTKLLNLQFDRLRHLSGMNHRSPKGANMEKIFKLTTAMKDSTRYYDMLAVILNSKEGKLGIATDRTFGLAYFVETINHMNQLGNTERAFSKDAEESINETVGRLFNVDVTKFPLPERDKVLREEIEKSSYLTPILYSNMLVAMTSYAIGYAKEVNSNYNKEIFDFKDIDLKGLKPTFEDLNRPSVKTVDVHSKAENALKRKKEDKRDSVIRKIKKDLNFVNKKGKSSFDTLKELITRSGIDCGIDFLEKTDDMKKDLDAIFMQLDSEVDEDENTKYLLQDDGKILKAKLQGYIDTLQANGKLKENRGVRKTSEEIIGKLSGAIEKIDQLFDINKEIIELEQEVTKTAGEVPYDDSSVFFDHIRNSFTHSYFKIDYDELFRTRDFSKIKFHMEDYDKNDDGTKRKTFEIDLTAEDLLYLMGAIQERLNRSVVANKKVELENVHLNMLRDDRGIQRYDITKYDSKSHPIKPVRKEDRATGEDFEASVSEDLLMKGLTSNALSEIQKTKEGGKKKE